MPNTPKPFSSGDLYFKVIGADKIESKLGKAEEEFRRVIARVVNESLINIDREAKQKAPRSDGQLVSGIHFTVATPERPVGVVGSYAKHAAWMEFGTARKGAETNRQPLPPWYEHGATHKFPPVAAFARWAQKHPVKVKGKRNKQVVSPFVWARAVYQNQGVAARPYFYPAGEKEAPVFTRRLEAAIQAKIAEMGGGQ